MGGNTAPSVVSGSRAKSIPYFKACEEGKRIDQGAWEEKAQFNWVHRHAEDFRSAIPKVTGKWA